MGRATSTKFFILLWKNFIIKVQTYKLFEYLEMSKLTFFQKRHWVIAVLEIIVPTLLFLAIVLLRAEGESIKSALTST